ncbi:cytoplasmic chaperone TorD family protein [Shewanella sediminis HAW-EB3]|uniref:Cytoplasmic chaperone TorD family protein n=1 Tax=Shewanella sediminis (strain HAW-EB3) TaxID=425104 RepID=A8FSU7_SHESH|nr:molecular chaperone [Shewanella sediminis]ABV35920.1 cytoplasmic chaperone TorD family protein [Shewanella sediminis HAW-EB3]
MQTKHQLLLASAASGILHNVFYSRPTPEFLCSLSSILKQWPLQTVPSKMAIEHIVNSIEIDDVTTLDEDYHALFVGPGKRHAYPWGSVYTDKEKLLFGDSTVAFEHFCLSHGIEFELDGNEPTDHVGLLLGALSTLLKQSDPEHLQAVSSLLEVHLLPWVSAFLDAVDENSVTGYYRGFSKLLRIWINDWELNLKLNPTSTRLY